MTDPLAWLDDELRTLDAGGLRRRLRTRVGPQGAAIRIGAERDEPGESASGPAELLNFGSNDYLAARGRPTVGGCRC